MKLKGHSLYLFLRSESHGLVTSGAAGFGGRRPLPVPRSCGTGPGAPPPTAAEVAQTFRQSLQNKYKECPGGFVSIILNTFIPAKKMGKLLLPGLLTTLPRSVIVEHLFSLILARNSRVCRHFWGFLLLDSRRWASRPLWPTVSTLSISSAR